MKAKVFNFNKEKEKLQQSAREHKQPDTSRAEVFKPVDEMAEKNKLQAERNMRTSWETFSNAVAPLIRRLKNSTQMDIPVYMLEALEKWENEYYTNLAEVDVLSPGYVHPNVRKAYKGALRDLRVILRTDMPSGRQFRASKWVDNWGSGFNINV